MKRIGRFALGFVVSALGIGALRLLFLAVRGDNVLAICLCLTGGLVVIFYYEGNP